MRVAIINSVCGTGSTGKICVDISRMLQKNGHTCKVFYGRGNYKNNDIDSFRFETDLEVYEHIFASRFLDCQGLRSNHATNKLIEELKNFNPDIINIHNIHGYYVNYELLFHYIIEHNIRVVWTLHDCWAFTGHCPFLNSLTCNKYQKGCEHCPAKKNYPASWLIDNSKNHYVKKSELYSKISNMRIVVPSIWLQNIVQQSILKKYQVYVINNGINTKVFRDSYSNNEVEATYNKYFNINITEKKAVLGVANIWSDRKGLKDIVKLSNELDDDYIICLVGLSKKQLKELPESIKGVVRTDNQVDLAHLYKGAFVYINPTYADNYPTTNIEAASCGTRVITYQTGGSGESIKDKRNVIPQGDINGLKEAIIHDYENGVIVDIDSETCYTKYLDVFTF